MANQISGSADATLVQAASKAAAASVPYDQSNTHRRLSRSYAEMAKATGDMWGKAIEVVGNVGSALVENAKSTNLDGAWEENQDQLVKDKTSGVNPDNKTGMVNVRNPKTGEIEEVAAENRFTHFDNNGNGNSITIQSTEEKLVSLRNELNSVKKNKTLSRDERKAEKRRIRNVIDNIRNSNIGFGDFSESMTQQLASGGINTKASGMYNMTGMLFADAMLAQGKPVEQTDPNLAMYNGARAVKGYDDNGEMVFTYVDKGGSPFKDKDGKNVTITKNDLNKLFVPVSPQREVMAGLVNKKEIRKNIKYGPDEFKDVINNTVNQGVVDKNTYLDLAFSNPSPDSTGSLADALNAVEFDDEQVPTASETPMFQTLISTIEGISGKDDLDVTGDGKFTKEDYATQENYDMLVKKALSGDNLELGKSLLKMHYNNEVAKIYNKEDLRLKSLKQTTLPAVATVTNENDYPSYDYDGDEKGDGGPMRKGQGSAFKINSKFI